MLLRRVLAPESASRTSLAFLVLMLLAVAASVNVADSSVGKASLIVAIPFFSTLAVFVGIARFQPERRGLWYAVAAAQVIGAVGDVARFPTKAHYFASYSGTAPVEASSGDVVRHRLSLAGNRKLNNALHMIAICQARSDVRGRTYHRKKIAEGKSRKEALRCLKRRISDAVFKSLMADLEVPSFSAA